jgi:DNA repair exonuclease SbcCD ATPase subunit
MKLREITIENFKAINFLNIVVGEKGLLLEGENRTHKTTVLTAILWALTDKDYDLTSKHELFPDDGHECTPSVKLKFEDITIRKYQKRTVKESKVENTNDSVIIDNKFEVNDVPMPLKDFTKKLTEAGIDMDIIVPCMHPDFFMQQVQKDMRKNIVGMGKTFTDSQIAAKKGLTKELEEPLKKYTMEELKAMSKASKDLADKQIVEIPLMIAGIEQSKSTFDLAELKQQKAVYNKQLDDIEKRLSKKDNGVGDLQHQKMEKQYELDTYVRDTSESVLNTQRDVERVLNDKKYALNKNNAYLNDYEVKKAELEEEVKQSIQFRQENVKSRYLEEVAKEFDESSYVADLSRFVFDESKWAFDESSTKCRLCGQDLPEEKIAELKESFEKKKQYEIDRIEKAKQNEIDRVEKSKENDKKRFLMQQDQNKRKILAEGHQAEEKEKVLSQQTADFEIKIVAIKERNEQLQVEIEKAQSDFDNCKKEIDFSSDKKYNDISAEIKNIQLKIEELIAQKEDTTILDESKLNIQNAIKDINDKIAVSKRNDELNQNIELQNNRLAEYVQKSADADRVLYLLKAISKLKNELLVDEINSKFDIVKWKLFDYQKNGEYKEVCTPMILEGSTYKEFKEQMSTGMRMQAKLDICFSLQKYYNMELPVLLDEASSLSEKYLPDLSGKQLIMAKVTKDDKLKITQL